MDSMYPALGVERFYGYDCVELDVKRTPAGRIKVSTPTGRRCPRPKRSRRATTMIVHPNPLVAGGAAFVIVTPPPTEPLTSRRRAFAASTAPTPSPPARSRVALAGGGGRQRGQRCAPLPRDLRDRGGRDGGGRRLSVAVTVADKTVNGKVSLTGIPLGGTAVTSRKLYRTAAGGSTYLLLATIADNTTTIYTDNTADSGARRGRAVGEHHRDPLLSD
jgi:hypothetical protein